MSLKYPGSVHSMLLHAWLFASLFAIIIVLIYLAARKRGDNIYKCGVGTLADNEEKQCLPHHPQSTI